MSLQLQMGIQPEGKRKNDMGRPVFLGTDPILYFPGSAFIHRDVIQKSHGVSSPDFYQIRCFIQMYTKKGCYIIFWPGGLLTIYDPLLVTAVSQPEHLLLQG